MIMILSSVEGHQHWATTGTVSWPVSLLAIQQSDGVNVLGGRTVDPKSTRHLNPANRVTQMGEETLKRR